MPRMPDMPCGYWFCPVPLRLLWPLKAVKLVDIGACYGRGRVEMERRARILEIWDLRPHGRVPVYSAAEFRKLWLDPNMTKAKIGSRFGMTRVQVYLHARRLGLPQRRTGVPPTYTFGPEFDAMWKARVMAREMAQVYGCAPTLILKEAARRGYPPRGRAGPRAITLAQFRLAEVARQEQIALQLAGMVDGRPRFPRAA